MIDKKIYEKMIRRVLILDGNETNFISKETRVKFNSLMLELSKSYFDIRYCTRLGCECSPETAIAKLLAEDDVKEFIKYGAGDNLYDSLLKASKEFNNITVHDFD